MTLHQLKVFVTVARLKSFTQAAETLRIRQPSVSLLIQGLQRELGVKLFEQLGKKVRLTRAGEELLPRAAEMLAKEVEIKEVLDDIKGLKKGKISIGGSGFAGASFLPVALQEFKNQYPAVDVALRIERSQVLEKMLLDGDLDLAVLGRPSESSLLLMELYHEEEIVCIAPPNHLLTRKHTVPLELIAREPLIVSGDGSRIRGMLEQKFAEKRIPFTPRLEIDIHQLGGRDAEKNAVANGLGIGFLTRCYVELDVRAGRLKVLKVPELKLKRTIYIAVHKNRKISHFVQAFSDFLKRYQQQ